MIRRLLFATLWLVWLAAAAPQPTTTTIQDTLYNANGTLFNGYLTISWTTFQSGTDTPIISNSTTVQVINGNLYVKLTPTTTATPAASYTVVYFFTGGSPYQEIWNVPASSTPLTVASVRASGSTLDTAGATIPESNVIGLTNDLNARPVEGPSFTSSAVAIVDSSGLLETATGNATDCVHVDGSTGACGSGSGTGSLGFVDIDAISGAVNGANATYTLSAVPTPAASLTLYRNGVLERSGVDYTLTGNTVQFVTAATPQTGDILTASYRTTTSSGSTPTFSSPELLCSGAGTSTQAATLNTVGTCNIPAGVLVAGDRVEIRFDGTHTGTAGTAALKVNWGGTAVLLSNLAAAETMVTGRADAALLASGAQLSWQNWGAVLALSAGVGTASDAYANGITVTFLGSVAQTSDTVTLTNFTVVRLP